LPAPALVDSNVLLDLLTHDSDWYEWSSSAVATVASETSLVINQIIYAEVSVRFSRVEDVDEAFPTAVFERESLPWAAGFLAGKVFVSYRRRRGSRSSPMPDFYIGAHAAVRGYQLLTRDPRRYAEYFPNLKLIAP
jgi:predicted nucleic acid-binding protein